MGTAKDNKFLSAVKNGNVAEVESLLKPSLFGMIKGANVNAPGKDDNTPLHAASWNGYKEIAELLIAKGADVNAVNAFGLTPLYWASENGHKEIVVLLIAKGADVNAANELGLTALCRASHKGHKEIAELLISKGANVNALDKNGRSPLGAKTKPPTVRASHVTVDFYDEYPQFCAIRTSLRTSQIDPAWVRNVLCLVLGSHLSYNDINQVRGLLSKMEAQGFRFVTVGSTPEPDIISGSGDEETKFVSNQAANHPRCVPLVMQDPLGQTGLIRFCFFFKRK